MARDTRERSVVHLAQTSVRERSDTHAQHAAGGWSSRACVTGRRTPRPNRYDMSARLVIRAFALAGGAPTGRLPRILGGTSFGGPATWRTGLRCRSLTGAAGDTDNEHRPRAEERARAARRTDADHRPPPHPPGRCARSPA